MRYWVCVLAGVILFAGCLYAFSDALTELLDTGTCASGNTPYVIAKQCPDGTGTNILLLVGSSFGLFASMLLFAFRGDPPGGGGRRRGVSPFLAGWAVFFTVTGVVSLLHALSSDTIGADGKAGGIIVGGMFLLLGLPVLVYLVWALLSGGGRDQQPAGLAGAMGFSAPPPIDHTRSEEAAFAPAGGFASGSAGAGGDRIAELERLDRLRRSGALTEAEFEREKARLLGG